MSYPLILNTLREFDLITDDQFREAYLTYEREEHAIRAQETAFREEFDVEWEKRPWWRKWFSSKDYEAGKAWSKQPFEVRYPQWAKEQEEIQRVLGEEGR